MQEGHKVLLQVRHQAVSKAGLEVGRVMGVVLVMAMGVGMVLVMGVVMAMGVERVLGTAAAGIWEMIRGLSVQNRKVKVKL